MAENWFAFISIYGIINIVCLVAGVFWCYDENGNFRDILFFPKLWTTAREDWDLNMAGAIIVCVFAGLFFLPAILFGCACLIAFFLIAVFCVLFSKIFKRRG
jgi:hypothetical protein